MKSPELSHLHPPPMAKPTASRNKIAVCLTNSVRFVGGALMAFLLVWSLSSFSIPNRNSTPDFELLLTQPTKKHSLSDADAPKNCTDTGKPYDMASDPPNSTFYDDPEMSYSIDDPVKNWDEKRSEWLKTHPSFAAGAHDRVILVTGSQPKACKNPIGDHLLLRFFKNKVDYCRLHGYDIFYNTALLHPKMNSYWAKLPAVRAAMMAHPEAEWIWWVDSDALITDMEFKLPLERYNYKSHNIVVHGWSHLIYESKSWTSLNAGIFLIRNCQWSMDFIDVWANMGPQSPDYEKWGKIQKSTFKDKLFAESDDQAALIYLLLKNREKYLDKIYLEGEYYFEGYWLDIIGTLDNITEKYTEMEFGAKELRRRHAEKVSESYGGRREVYLKDAGNGRGSWRRPFITHFTGCQPCSGDHNQIYDGESCWSGMIKAFNFADNQVLRKYGFVHPNLLDYNSVSAVSFDYPA